MKTTLKLFAAALACATMMACPGPGPGGNDAGNGFPQPSGTVPVNFTVDDTANHVYAQGDLQWKGSFYWDKTTRKLTKDSSWTGGNGTTTEFPTLYDDGPWSSGGHEPSGATAGDHKWGVTVFATPPATGSDAYEYGLNDSNACKMDAGVVVGCNGWAWVGSNGTFSVAAGATNAITASGETIPSFGTTDLRLSLNTNALDTPTLSDGGTQVWSTSTVTVKGSAWNWSEALLSDSGGGHYVFDMADWVGSGKPFPHGGLTTSGQQAQFVWVLGGAEYKSGSGDALDGGVLAEVKPSGGAFSSVPVLFDNGSHNTYVTIP